MFPVTVALLLMQDEGVWLVGWLAGWLGWLAGRQAGWLACRQAGWLGRLTSWLG